ncbi:DNA cytosine methyltransferase [Deinococcus sp. QL22]|uniref:DNA cytosine methyltransferase n=1 Tax=Deinococcus sp. QL22 TaxID=2939437 RepID=UPI0035304531
MKFGSLFAGIGGLDLGLEWAGMTCAWQVEINDYAGRVLKKHWPAVPLHKDVRDVGGHNLDPVDLICGGFPCQPHSFAGSRKADEDDRDLWEEFARIIRELGPRWVLAENVPGLLSSRFAGQRGGFFGKVLADLAEIGYDAEWDCIPASALGAHHQRDRVFVIAYPNGLGSYSFGTHGESSGQPKAFGHAGSDVAHADRSGCEEQHSPAQPGWAGEYSRRSHAALADANGERQPQSQGSECHERRWTSDRSADVADDTGLGQFPRPKTQHAEHDQADSQRASDVSRIRAGAARPDWSGPHPYPLTERDETGREIERDVYGVAHGVSARVDRLRGLGNAVVPAVSYHVGSLIMAAHQAVS